MFFFVQTLVGQIIRDVYKRNMSVIILLIKYLNWKHIKIIFCNKNKFIKFYWFSPEILYESLNIILIFFLLKWIRHRYTCVPHPEPASLLPPHTIPLGRSSAPCFAKLNKSRITWLIKLKKNLFCIQMQWKWSTQ